MVGHADMHLAEDMSTTKLNAEVEGVADMLTGVAEHLNAVGTDTVVMYYCRYYTTVSVGIAVM